MTDDDDWPEWIGTFFEKAARFKRKLNALGRFTSFTLVTFGVMVLLVIGLFVTPCDPGWLFGTGSCPQALFGLLLFLSGSVWVVVAVVFGLRRAAQAVRSNRRPND